MQSSKVIAVLELVTSINKVLRLLLRSFVLFGLKLSCNNLTVVYLYLALGLTDVGNEVKTTLLLGIATLCSPAPLLL